MINSLFTLLLQNTCKKIECRSAGYIPRLQPGHSTRAPLDLPPPKLCSAHHRSALAPVTLLLAFVLTALLSAAAAVHTLRPRGAAPPSASEAARAFVLLADQLIATFPAEWSAPDEDLDPSLVILRCPPLPFRAAALLPRASPSCHTPASSPP